MSKPGDLKPVEGVQVVKHIWWEGGTEAAVGTADTAGMLKSRGTVQLGIQRFNKLAMGCWVQI